MRPIDRDLIRGGHYGQRSCEPHAKAEHMAAPTNAALVKKVLANSEPSTHGPECRLLRDSITSEFEGKAYQDWHNNEYKLKATAAVITGPVEGTTTESAKAAE
jgi:hypothetical protein